MTIPEKAKKKHGLEHLQRIINLSQDVEEKRLDPFLVDVNNIISILRKYFPEWKNPEELCLDAEALHGIASVIKQQSEWVKHRSTSLYTDPFLLEEKIRRLDKKQIATLFLKAWHPIIELEQISTQSIIEAIRYWQNLLPLNERWQKTSAEIMEMGETTRNELINQRILAEKAFTEELENLWRELKQKVGENGKVDYWSFIGADTYEETVHRAYMTSFLVTYGYATLEVYPMEEEVFIKPHEKPKQVQPSKQTISIPVPINIEDWKRWIEGKKNE